jgi:hypothetical protein
MIILTTTFIRPSKDVPWHYSKLDAAAYLGAVSENAGILSRDMEDSALEAKFTVYFRNQESYDQYLSNHAVQEFKSRRDAYNAENGITINSEEEHI